MIIGADAHDIVGEPARHRNHAEDRSVEGKVDAAKIEEKVRQVGAVSNSTPRTGVKMAYRVNLCFIRAKGGR
jgi:hypothetical protein